MNHDNDLQYEYFPSIRQHTVEWLWYPYIPYGKFTVLQGDPGEGNPNCSYRIPGRIDTDQRIAKNNLIKAQPIRVGKNH